MAAGSTYTPIATTTLTATAGIITFSSIPSIYTDLILIVQGKFDVAGDLRYRLNNDTSTNYSFTILYGTGSSNGSARSSSVSSGIGDSYGNIDTTLGNSVQILQFLNYSNTTTYKTSLVRSNNASGGVDALVNLWRSTSAINQIDLAKNSSMSGTWQIGSIVTLYGIAAA